MAFEHNDIATKSGLRAGLGETEMGFEHNDIVTTDVMNAAIAAGGGGGGDLNSAKVTLVSDKHSAYEIYAEENDNNNYAATFDLGDEFNYSFKVEADETATATIYYTGESVTISHYNKVTSVTGSAVYDSDTNTITISGDCTITGWTDD